MRRDTGPLQFLKPLAAGVSDVLRGIGPTVRQRSSFQSDSKSQTKSCPFLCYVLETRFQRLTDPGGRGSRDWLGDPWLRESSSQRT